MTPGALAITILEAMSDPALFARRFPEDSWRAWRAFLAALCGLPMSEADLQVFRACTGRHDAPGRAAHEAWVIVGRRGGKSRIAALVAVFLACFRDYRHILAPGERGTLMVIAADRKQARNVFRYIVGLLDGVPMLARLIIGRTAETVDLDTGVSIEVHTANFRAVRGYTIVGAICDEIAFWRSDDSANPDVEILNGLRPGMATVPGTLLLCISSPYGRRGALWEAHQQHFGRDGDPVLVWQAGSKLMNPSVPDDFIAEAYAKDAVAAAAEYGAQFRSDLEAFVSREIVDATIMRAQRERPPAGHRYVAFCDPAGGSGGDSMTLAIAHAEQGHTVLDLVCEARPPFSPEQTVEQFAEVLRRYLIRRVVGDKFAGEWPAERFRKHRITYEAAEQTKSQLYSELLPLLNSGAIRLVDDARLVSQLLALERRTAWGGRDSIDHPPGAHDDLVNAAAGALVLAARGSPRPAAGTGLPPGVTIIGEPATQIGGFVAGPKSFGTVGGQAAYVERWGR